MTPCFLSFPVCITLECLTHLILYHHHFRIKALSIFFITVSGTFILGACISYLLLCNHPLTTTKFVPSNNSLFNVWFGPARRFLPVWTQLISAGLFQASMIIYGLATGWIIEKGVFHRYKICSVDCWSWQQKQMGFTLLVILRVSSQSCCCGYLRVHMQKNCPFYSLIFYLSSLQEQQGRASHNV